VYHRQSNHLEEFHQQHNDTNIIIYNINSEILYLMENYQQFNFTTDIGTWSSYQETDVQNYIWVDDIHPSYVTNDIVVEDIVRLLKSISHNHHKPEEKN